ncbi:hypothetical protein JW948_14120 [bacterium]|nr:hypothetical protein [bacterium]
MEGPLECTEKTMAWLDGALARQEAGKWADHVERCETCRAFAADYRIISHALSHRQRTGPFKSMLDSYHTELSRLFSVKSAPPRRSWVDRLLLSPAPAMRLGQAAAMLVLGISLGWFLTRQPSREKESVTVVMDQTAAATARPIDDFFHESEIWLLDVMNLPQNGKLADQEWKVTRSYAERLLGQIVIIREMSKADEEKQVQTYLDGFEILLLDMINSQKNDRSEILMQIRQAITELDLLFRADMIRDQIQSDHQHI